MTDLTVTQTLAIGLPIAFFIIFLEAVLSAWQKKSYYKTSDTLCTLGFIGWKHGGSSSHQRTNFSFPYLSLSVQGF